MTPAILQENTPDNAARFLLASVGTNPLVCVGVNPSTATPQKLDTTVTRVTRYAALNGHDSWAMLNLYPQRSTDPRGMHSPHLPELKVANEQHIAEFIGGRKLRLLAAWGGLIRLRPYLRGMLEGIVEISDASSCEWSTIGGLPKNGHPRHPSRGAYVDLWPFDIHAYLRTM